MTAAVETMAYTGQVPWHGLGQKVEPNQTPKQMLKAAQLQWTVSKRPIGIIKPTPAEIEGGPDTYALDSGPIDGQFALTRDTDQQVLSIVGSGYKPVQNEAAFEFFKKFTEAGHMQMETAGSLQNGRYVWGLAKINKHFKLGKGDDIEGYLLLAQPHVGGKALVLQFTGIRVVCWNTFSMALAETLARDDKGRQLRRRNEEGKVFRMPHSQKFDEGMQAKAEQVLGLATNRLDEFKDVATLLSSKRAPEQQVEKYFMDLLRLDDDVIAEIVKGEKKKPVMLEKLQYALEHAPGQHLATAQGTWWGAFNAVTAAVDHKVGSTRDLGLYNAWMGNGQNLKRRALDLAVENAKA